MRMTLDRHQHPGGSSRIVIDVPRAVEAEACEVVGLLIELCGVRVPGLKVVVCTGVDEQLAGQSTHPRRVAALR